MSHFGKLLVLSFLVSLQISGWSQAGVLDQTFSGDGKVVSPVGSGDDQAFGVACQTNGKIVVVGRSAVGNASDFAIVRYNEDGSLDNSFSGDGKLLVDIAGGVDEARSVVILANGNILVAGFASVGNSIDFAIIELSSDGKLSSSFSGDGKASFDFTKTDDYCYSMLVSNNRIYLAGTTTFNSQEEFALATLKMDGNLDPLFDGDGLLHIDVGPAPDFGTALAIQSDGKLVMTGYTGSDFNTDVATIRLQSDGKLDPSFSQDGKQITDIGPNGERVYSVAIQKDQKIIVAGYTYNITGNDFAMVRFLPDGSLDKTFNMDGIVVQDIGKYFDEAYAMMLQSDGKIIATGEAAQAATDADFGLARFTESGVLDKSFSGDGIVITPMVGGEKEDLAYAIAMQADGKIVIAGEVENGANLDFGVARYTSGLSIATENYKEILSDSKIYPNPFQDYFILDFTLKENKKLTIQMVDASGKLVQHFYKDFELAPGNHKLTFKVTPDIAPAKYYLKIVNEKDIQVIEVVKIIKP